MNGNIQEFQYRKLDRDTIDRVKSIKSLGLNIATLLGLNVELPLSLCVEVSLSVKI